MKKFVLFLSAASMLVACNNVPKTSPTATTPAVNPIDTAGLGAYNASKTTAVSELPAEPETRAVAPKATKEAAPKVKTVTRYRYVNVPKSTPSPQPVPAPTPASEPVATSGAGTSVGSDQGTATSESGSTAPAEQKKGWSKAAKGAVIGGVAGAAAGAVINKKNRAAGAVIGGIIGAAGGYGVGRGQDKKDGRIQIH